MKKSTKKYNGITYDANCWSLLSSIIPFLRPKRDHIEQFLNTDDWLFCSELVAEIYVKLGIFPDTVDPKNVVPMDFIGYDLDHVDSGGIAPNKFEQPKEILISTKLLPEKYV